MKKYIIVCGLFILAIVLVYFFLPDYGNGNYGKVIINEVMAKNTNTIVDEDNEYSDYIEIYNGHDFPVNLDGYHLSDKEFETDMWTFPETTIGAHEYLIIFASGKDKFDKYIHTNFKLGSEGEVITLTDKKGNILSKITYEETMPDTSYGKGVTRYVYFKNPTPGKKNDKDFSNHPIMIANKKVKVRINEYVINNTFSIVDNDGEYSDFIELYNYGKVDINLHGYYLTDDNTNLGKYMLPDVTIKANDYLIIYANGKNKYEDGYVNTNFKLGEGDKELILSTGKKEKIDSVKVVSLSANNSYGYNDNKWCYFMTATPGSENNTKCFEVTSNGST